MCSRQRKGMVITTHEIKLPFGKKVMDTFSWQEIMTVSRLMIKSTERIKEPLRE